MNVYEAATTRRTVRRFTQQPVPQQLLTKLVNAARLAPSAGNGQPLEFIAVTDPEVRGRLFMHLAWAGHVRPWRNPAPEHRPTAYVLVLVNLEKAPDNAVADAAAAIENMLLVAEEEGLGACWIGSVQRNRVQSLLGVPEEYALDSVVALGYPAERPVTEGLKDSHRYWIDEHDTLHVPKRKLEDVLHWEKFG